MDCIDFLASGAINGDFGNLGERIDALGPLYGIVQNRVNERLGYPKRYPIDYNW